MGTKNSKNKGKKEKKPPQYEEDDEYAAVVDRPYHNWVPGFMKNSKAARFQPGILKKGIGRSMPNLYNSGGRNDISQFPDYEEVAGRNRAVHGQGMKNKNQGGTPQGSQVRQNIATPHPNHSYTVPAVKIGSPVANRAHLPTVQEEPSGVHFTPQHAHRTAFNPPVPGDYADDLSVLNQERAMNIDGEVWVPLSPNLSTATHTCTLHSPISSRHIHPTQGVKRQHSSDMAESHYSNIRRPVSRQPERLRDVREAEPAVYARPIHKVGSPHADTSATQASDSSIDADLPIAAARFQQDINDQAINNQMKVKADIERNFPLKHHNSVGLSSGMESYQLPRVTSSPRGQPIHSRDGRSGVMSEKAPTPLPSAESLSYETSVTRNGLVKIRLEFEKYRTVYFTSDTVGDFCARVKSEFGHACCVADNDEMDQSLYSDWIKLDDVRVPFVINVNAVRNVVLSKEN